MPNLKLTPNSQYAPRKKDSPQRKAVYTSKFKTSDLLPIVLQESDKTDRVPSTVCIFLWALDRKSKHIHYFLPNVSQCLREAKHRKTQEGQWHTWPICDILVLYKPSHFKQKSLIWYGRLPLHLIYTIQPMSRGVQFSLVRVTLSDLGMALPHSEVKSRQWHHPAELFFSGSPRTWITKAKEKENRPDFVRWDWRRVLITVPSCIKEWSHSPGGSTVGPAAWHRGSLSAALLIPLLWITGLSLEPGFERTVLGSWIYAFRPSCRWDLKTSEPPSLPHSPHSHRLSNSSLYIHFPGNFFLGGGGDNGLFQSSLINKGL